MNLLEIIAAVYAWTGLLFGIAFAIRGANCLDDAARGGTWGFRVLIVPGAAALWPWLLTKWVRA